MPADTPSDTGIRFVDRSSASFDGMCWPRAGARCGHVEWRLRHGGSQYAPPTDEEIISAASVLAAYRHLVHCPRSHREAVIRRLREVERLWPVTEEEAEAEVGTMKVWPQKETSDATQ